MVDTTIQIDLYQIPTGDLIEELKCRKGFEKEELAILSAWELIGRLQELGCPQRIIEQLEAWEREPIVDTFKLKRWREFCEIT